jgi:hypothetical protein
MGMVTKSMLMFYFLGVLKFLFGGLGVEFAKERLNCYYSLC